MRLDSLTFNKRKARLEVNSSTNNSYDFDIRRFIHIHIYIYIYIFSIFSAKLTEVNDWN